MSEPAVAGARSSILSTSIPSIIEFYIYAPERYRAPELPASARTIPEVRCDPRDLSADSLDIW